MTDKYAGHTPGPWAVNPINAQVDAFDGEGCAPIPVCQLLWPTDLRTEATTEANARLIAAAPALYEALVALEPHLDAIVCYASTMGEHEPNRLVANARAALSLALGEAPNA